MSSSYDLFCRWKHVNKLGSDNAGATALGVSRSTVSLWKQGKNAEIHLIERMAQDIGDAPEMWAARVMAERSGSEEEQSAWTRIAQRLSAFAAVLLLATLPYGAGARPTETGFNFAEKASSMDYVLRTVRYLWRLVCDLLASKVRRGKAADTLEATVCL